MRWGSVVVLAGALAWATGCDTAVDRTGLRSVCQIALAQRTCVYGELPLVDGDGGAGAGRTDCRLFDSEKEIDRSQYVVLPGPSELCDGAMWHVELAVEVDVAPGELFLVCRNDSDRRCPAPRQGGTARACRPGETTIVAEPRPGGEQFLVSLVGDETGGLLVWGRGEAGASRDAYGTWLDQTGAPIFAGSGAEGVPVADSLVRGLPGATMRGGVVSVPLSGEDARIDASDGSLARIDVASLESPQPLDVLAPAVPLLLALPFGELDGVVPLGAVAAAALAPSSVRFAMSADGQIGATWIQGLVALDARSDEAYRTLRSGRSGAAAPHVLGSVRPDSETAPAIARAVGGWGIAFAASYRIGATGTGFAWLGDDGATLRATKFAAGLVPTGGLSLAAAKSGSFVAASLGDTGDVALALFPPGEEDVLAPVPVDRAQLGVEMGFSPRAISLAPIGNSGDVLLAAIASAPAGTARFAHRLLLARLAPRTQTVSIVGSTFVELGQRTSFEGRVCAASDGASENARTRVFWSLDEGSGASIGSVLVEPLSLTELAVREVQSVDDPATHVRSLACDGAGGSTVAVWLTDQKWQAAWFDAMGGVEMEQGGALTDDEHLSVALLSGGRAALVGRRDRGLWRLEAGVGRYDLDLPVRDESIASTFGPLVVGASRGLAGDEVIAVADVLGAAGGADRDVVAITGHVSSTSIDGAGEPVLLSTHRGLPLVSPRVTTELAPDGTERFAYLATLGVPGGSAIVVERDTESADGDRVSVASTFTLGAATTGARVAAAIPERDGIRILVDDPQTAIVTTLPTAGSSPERTRVLWSDVSLSDDAMCPGARPRGLALARVDGIELSAFAALCATGENAVRIYVGTADDRGVPLAALDPQVPLAAGTLWVRDTERAPPALAARVGDGLVVAFQNAQGAVVLRRFECVSR